MYDLFGTKKTNKENETFKKIAGPRSAENFNLSSQSNLNLPEGNVNIG